MVSDSKQIAEELGRFKALIDELESQTPGEDWEAEEMEDLRRTVRPKLAVVARELAELAGKLRAH